MDDPHPQGVGSFAPGGLDIPGSSGQFLGGSVKFLAVLDMDSCGGREI